MGSMRNKGRQKRKEKASKNITIAIKKRSSQLAEKTSLNQFTKELVAFQPHENTQYRQKCRLHLGVKKISSNIASLTELFSFSSSTRSLFY